MFSIKNLPDEVHTLREEFGSGYEMRDVLTLLSSMMTEYKALEEAWQLKGWGKEYHKPEPYKKRRLRAARSSGFTVEDVTKLVNKPDDQIVQMRAKLDVERDKKNWNQEWQSEAK